MVLRFVPNLKPQKGQHFDIYGAVFLFLSVLSLLLALTFGQQKGFLNLGILLLFTGWILFLLLFYFIEKTAAQPMIDLALFKNMTFSVGLISGLAVFIAISGTTILMPFYLEDVLGFSPKSVGLLMTTVPGLMGVIAPLSGSLSDRFGSRPMTLAGLLILFFGYCAVSTLNRDTTVMGYVLRFLPIGIGMGMFQSPNNSAIMGSAPSKRLGVASGMLALTRTLGQTTGIALLSALWASRSLYYEQLQVANDMAMNSAFGKIRALQETFVVVVLLFMIIISIVVWSIFRERKLHAANRNTSYTSS